MPGTTFSTAVAIVGALATCVVLADARIESFSPTGFNKDVRQVTVRFSEPMVALGDPARESPFTVECAVPGAGRWIDERHWVYDFDYDVPGAVRCRFALRDDVRTYAGEEVTVGDEGSEYVFDTGGPDILAHEPTFEIDERQVFLLALDAVATPESIRQHARCRVAGEQSRAVELLEGADRAEVLDALWEYELGLLLDLLVDTASGLLPSGDEDETRAWALQRIVALRCLGPLPNSSYVDLIWGAGIQGESGLATTHDDSLKFSVRPEFRATLKCSETFEDRCLGGVHIAFSALVRRELAGGIRLVDDEGNVLDGEMEAGTQVERVDFPVADQEGSVYRAELLGRFADIDGRPLANTQSFPQTVRIGRPPPSASFAHGLHVVEPGEDAAAPILLRSLSGSLTGRRLRFVDDASIVAWMRSIMGAQDDRDDSLPGSPWRQPLIGSRGQPFTLPVPGGSTSTQVAGLPLAMPGLHVMEVELPPADGLPRRYVAGMAMATDLGVHFHRGAESSLVWVTRLSDAKPVADADVRILDGCTGRELARETTDGDGLAGFPQELPGVSCENNFRYLVSARKDGDLAVVASGDWPLGRWNTRVHTILDRTLIQPGETVSMKVIVRRRTSDGLTIPEEPPATVKVTARHDRSGDEYQQTIDLAANGSVVGSFVLPESAMLGSYDIDVEFDGDVYHQWSGFRVERFQVGAMRAAVQGSEDPLVNPGSVPLGVSVEYQHGGGAAALPVTVRTVLRRWYEDWAERVAPVEHVLEVVLDAAGQATVDVPIPELDGQAYLYVDLDYQDANGQRRTARNGFELWPAAVALRIRDVQEAAGRKWLSVEARRPGGDVAPGVLVETSVHSARIREERRLPGGFRSTQLGSKSPLLASCSGTTDANGTMTCEVPAEVPRAVFIEALARDAEENLARASATRSFWSWGAEPRMLGVDITEEFAVGDIVPIRVNLPFTDATALVTMRRDGVLDPVVERLQGPDAVVKIPVRHGYAPNVGVSVLAVRGRTAPGIPVEVSSLRAGGDPHAPDYRHESVRLPVSLDTHTLTVRVLADRESYGVRERSKVLVEVRGPDGSPRPDADVLLVAVDEALLELWPNPTWDLLDEMMGGRSAGVDTKTNLPRRARLLFDPSRAKDLRNLGDILFSGDYGVNSSSIPYRTVDPLVRRNFDTLLLWRGRLSTGTGGTAEIDIPLNDSLTSFRIVAVATAGHDLFGTGEATIRTTQDLVVHAGLPQTVREGDRFDAVFTVHNASDRARRVTVEAGVDGLNGLPRQRLRLRPGRSREVSWPVTVPVGAEALAWEISATSRGASDRLASRQTVEPAVPVRVQQATLTHLSEPRELPVAPPIAALPGRGGMRVSLEPSLLGGLETVREAMARYRYSCIEQKISAAIALGDEQRWSAAMEDVRAAMDPEDLVRFFPSRRLFGSPTLTAYVLAVADAAGKPIPQELREDMIHGLESYLDGRLVRRSALPSVDEPLRRLTVLAALARHGAATAERVKALDLNVEGLPNSGLLDWIDTLSRVDPDGSDILRAKAILRTRLNVQGTTMSLSTEDRDWLWWLMVSPDGNAARAVLAVLEDPHWRVEAPRMVRGLFGRQHRGRWQTTVANAWGTVAAQRFAAVFEADPVTGSSVVRLGDAQHRVEWPDVTAAADSPAPVDVPWSSAARLTLDHQGTGTPWGFVQLRAAVPRTEPIRAGYRIQRRVEPVLRENADSWQRGDVARVELTITADADMTWVVVEDPIPPGATILGSGLGGDSYMLSEGRVGDRWPVFTERDFDSYRAYFRYVPKGTFTVAYSVRYNTSGDFRLPPSRVEAMYMPEMFAEEPVPPISIE